MLHDSSSQYWHKLFCVHQVKHTWCPIVELLVLMQIGEYFEGLESDKTSYQVNAYLSHKYPEDWLADI